MCDLAVSLYMLRVIAQQVFVDPKPFYTNRDTSVHHKFPGSNWFVWVVFGACVQGCARVKLQESPCASVGPLVPADVPLATNASWTESFNYCPPERGATGPKRACERRVSERMLPFKAFLRCAADSRSIVTLVLRRRAGLDTHCQT